MSYHCFERSGKYYIYDIMSQNFACVPNDLGYAMMVRNFDNLSEESRQIRDYFRQQHIFFGNEINSFSKVKPRQIYFSFPPSHACNLACKYCFADSGKNYKGTIRKMSPATAKRVSQFLIDQFPTHQNFRLDLTSGGEPLIDKEAFKNLILEVRNVFRQNGKHLFIWMSTNGTLLTSDILPFLQENQVFFGISLDGPQYYHDRMRPYQNGNGSYVDVVRNIKEMLQSSTYSNRLKELWGLSVITSQAPPLTEIVQFYEKMQFQTLQMRLVRSNDSSLKIKESELKRIRFEIDSLCDLVVNQAQMGKTSALSLITNDNDYIGKLFRRLLLNLTYIQRCYAGEYKFSFTANGDIYPCDAFVGIEQFKLGSIDDGFYDQNSFFPTTVNQRLECRKCWARNICGGDCYHNSFLVNGNYNIPDSIFCDYTRYTIEAAIATLCQINDINSDLYGQLVQMLRLRTQASNT